MTTFEILTAAKEGKKELSGLTTEKKNQALAAMAAAIKADEEAILEANKADMEAAEGKISQVMMDRLKLDSGRIDSMAKGITDLIALPDPVGVELSHITRPNGIDIRRVSVPMGVIAIIYESRPNVTSDAAALSFKAGSVSVLRSGKEAYNSAAAIVKALRAGLKSVGLPENLINLIEDTSRASANELMTAVGYVDLLIPRGGAGLIRACVENAAVPCIETGTGICHIYVDKDADVDMAANIALNAKASRPSVCNSAEVCIVHRDIAERFLPVLREKLVTERKENPVELRLDAAAREYIDGKAAGGKDFDTEFLDYVMGVKVVDSLEEAVEHIAIHSTHHSDCIVTENSEAAEQFLNTVDSAAVYWNVSTRFTDGGEFGLGCEMGISTQKLHARGPMGLQELTTYKYVIRGAGQVR